MRSLKGLLVVVTDTFEYYTCEDYPGIIFENLGHPIETTVDHWGDVVREEYNEEQLIIRMVGDSKEHIYYIDDLKPYSGFVCSCGQLGCTHG
jgi:hypothetical protein